MIEILLMQHILTSYKNMAGSFDWGNDYNIMNIIQDLSCI